ncbi:TonB-dependent receptor [Mucilaginibacter sp. SMC90]|uniref:SusC/RagA family TonB-linked outer membrane protein n=1 Tax=Mucilaginibacter sp. SMC90 TaxID=2929803 RepID=UPI001FB56B13|nr:TonB-dependent receptor [Mucilaginibacter sp. SMC90]UOE47245.1 TonB-dependent receptor [Mucilaginibacter sp. SMC90]
MDHFYLWDQPRFVTVVLRKIVAKATIVFVSLLLLTFTASAQSKKISGTVTDSKGQTLPGVSVAIKNTANGTVTNALGAYTITVPNNDAVLIFTFVGLATQEKPVGTATTINVTLADQNNSLGDVVVVGYGVQKKVNVIGSVATVSAKDLENRPVTNVSSALTGLSAGVQVQQTSANPSGDGATIRIRGLGTLNNNGALVIIDGIQGTLDAVNPMDIESISILKDAAASSIYGSLAANGVILVTTKKGAKNKTNVSYSAIVSQTRPNGLPSFVSDYVRHMQLVNEGYRNLGQTPIYTDATIAQWQQADADPNGLNAIGVPNHIAYPNTDWAKVIFKNNILQNHNITLNGGNDNTQYLISAGYLYNPGVMPNTGANKYQLRINLQSKVNKFLTVGTQTFGSQQNFSPGNTGDAFNFLYQTTPGVYPLYNGKYGFPSAPEESATANNILSFLNSNGGTNQVNRLNTTVFANADLYKGLTLELKANYQTRSQEDNKFSVPFEKWNLATNQLKTTSAAPNVLTTYYDFNKDYLVTLDATLKYNTTIAKDHSVAALFGYDQYYYKYYNFNATKQGLIDPTITTLNSATTPIAATGDAYDYALRSFFGRLNYDFKQRYLIEAVFRYDGSSKFAGGNRWGFFPAVAAGWRISEEPFMKNADKYISNLKLRASWGQTGNNASAGNYDYQASYGTVAYSFNGAVVNGLASTKFANPNLHWETTTTTNLGLSGSLFHDALNFEADVYRKYTDGILFVPTIPITVGTASAATQNIAAVNNKGIELSLNYQGKAGGFNYSVSGNIAYNFNRVQTYKGGLQEGYVTDASGSQAYASNIGLVSSGGSTRIIEGHIINEYYLNPVYKGNGGYFNGDGSVNKNGGPKDGMIRTPQDMAWLNAMVAAGYKFLPANGVSKTQIYYGDLIYGDTNGDGIYGNSFDAKFTNKSSLPKYNAGFQLNMSYKGFDAQMIWAGSFGMYYYWNANGYTNSIVQLGYAVNNIVANDHYYYNEANPSDPANNINAHYPRLKNTSDPQNAGMASDFYLYNASYAKLKNAQLGYTLPKRWTQKLALSKVRVFIEGENLITITSYPGLDPEIGAGIGYPTMRQYSVGINASF